MASGLTQWGVLTRRTLEILVRNRLTLAILVGSPALVVAMFAILFRPGAFDFDDPSPSSMVMIGFWVVFAAFFFGLTYGLLQICTERTILRRERLVGLRPGAYVASKVTILAPFLLLVVVAMLGVLRLLDRLPSRPLSTYASIGVSLLLCAVAALGLGLLTSALVGNVAQATLALPMLCFPAVLFSGAILPVNLMATAGAALSVAIPSRWAFEAIGHDLGARRILAEGGSPLGPPLLASYGDAGTHSTGTYWLVLAAFAVVFLVATWAVIVRSTRRRCAETAARRPDRCCRLVSCSPLGCLGVENSGERAVHRSQLAVVEAVGEVLLDASQVHGCCRAECGSTGVGEHGVGTSPVVRVGFTPCQPGHRGLIHDAAHSAAREHDLVAELLHPEASFGGGAEL